MADTAITITDLVANDFVANPAGTAIVAANTHSITPASPLEEIILRITNTFAGAKIVTVTAGDNPPADAAGQGTVTKSLAQNEVWWAGPFTSARFSQDNGSLVVTVATSMTGDIAAFRIPRNA